MCNPAALMVGSMVVGGVGTAISYEGQRRAASQAEARHRDQYNREMAYREENQAYQLERYIENAERTHDEVRRNYTEIDQRIQQDAQTAAMEVHKYIAQSRALQSTSTATEAERAVTGPTADLIMDNIHRHVLRSVENVRREQRWRLDVMMGMKDEVEAQGIARIESMNPQPIPLPNLPPVVQYPDPMVSLMNFGSMAMGSYADFLQGQPVVPKTNMGAPSAATGAAAASQIAAPQMPAIDTTSWIQGIMV